MYTVLRPGNWEDATRIGRATTRWAFRGHSSAEWPLVTSLERLSLLGGTPPGFLGNTEFWILHEFRRRAHILLPSAPAPECHLEWLALIQHYGGPTRLLDFTHSFYVAAFFAVENAVADAAIWGVDLN